MKEKEKFPHENFPFRLQYKEEKNTKICWFQCEDHLNKYLERSKLNPKDYKIETNGVEIVGKGTRRKSTQKRSNRRQSSNS